MPALPNRAPIEAILFDLGGVLVELAGIDRMLAWCPHFESSDTMWRHWLASPAVRRFETGAASREDFAAEMVAEFRLPVDGDAFLAEFADWPRALHAGATDLLDALRPGYTLASLSNTNDVHWERLETQWNLPSRFHHNFPSHRVGRLKPDADYFEHVIATLGVRPARALFVDDNAINVEAASRVGLLARRAVSPDGVRAVLADLGVELPAPAARTTPERP